MKALVTGASSGIGKDMAIYLSKLGYELILVAREQKKLEEVQSKLNTNSQIICMDLCIPEKCIELHNQVRDVDIVINNAGFGDFGDFSKTDLNKELNMINTNITAVHILTKLFLADMEKRNSGHILNTGSIAAFMPGPLMATYYSTKSYVFRLTESIYEELNQKKSKVKISCLCPGPTNTGFFDKANVKFHTSIATSEYVAKYAIDKMLKGKTIILPGFQTKAVKFLSKIVPDKIISKVTYRIQERRK